MHFTNTKSHSLIMDNSNAIGSKLGFNNNSHWSWDAKQPSSIFVPWKYANTNACAKSIFEGHHPEVLKKETVGF